MKDLSTFINESLDKDDVKKILKVLAKGYKKYGGKVVDDDNIKTIFNDTTFKSEDFNISDFKTSTKDNRFSISTIKFKNSVICKMQINTLSRENTYWYIDNGKWKQYYL